MDGPVRGASNVGSRPLFEVARFDIVGRAKAPGQFQSLIDSHDEYALFEAAQKALEIRPRPSIVFRRLGLDELG